MKWSQEAISSYSHVAHGLAWGLAATKTVILLVISGVDGDPVAGICYVGNTNLLLLRSFVLAPNIVYLLLGVTFLIAGLVAMCRIRNQIKTQSKITDTLKLEKVSSIYLSFSLVTVLCLIGKHGSKTNLEFCDFQIF